jgi:hypothetical protein
MLNMSSSEDRLMKAIWGQPELMYDRRQSPARRSSRLGGRRAADWPKAFARQEKRFEQQASRWKFVM